MKYLEDKNSCSNWNIKRGIVRVISTRCFKTATFHPCNTTTKSKMKIVKHKFILINGTFVYCIIGNKSPHPLSA